MGQQAVAVRQSIEADMEMVRQAVKVRLKEAGGILGREPMPPEWRKLMGGAGNWPNVLYTRNEQGAWNKPVLRPAPPTAVEIKRMDEVLEWLLWIDDGKVRSVVFACMFVGYRKVARGRPQRCSHTAIRKIFERGVTVITTRLLK